WAMGPAILDVIDHWSRPGHVFRRYDTVWAPGGWEGEVGRAVAALVARTPTSRSVRDEPDPRSCRVLHVHHAPGGPCDAVTGAGRPRAAAAAGRGRGACAAAGAARSAAAARARLRAPGAGCGPGPGRCGAGERRGGCARAGGGVAPEPASNPSTGRWCPGLKS